MNYVQRYNSYCGDSLLDDPFSSVEKFDYVAGNPPYVSFMRSKNNDNEYKKKLDNKFESFARKGDIYYLFVEQAISRSKNLVGMVTQDTFSKGEYSESLRRIVKKNGAIIANDIYKFDNAEVYARMFCFKQGSKEETLLKENIIIEKLVKNRKVLRDYTTTCQGINTGNNKLFIVTENICNEKDFEKIVTYPIIKGSDIRSYRSLNVSNVANVAIVCNDINVDDFPNVRTYIESNREAEKSYHWKKKNVKRIYDITQYKTWPVQDNLIVGALYTVSGNDFTISSKGMVGVSGSSYALPNLEKVWLGILNSNVASYFYLQTSKRRTAKLLQRSGTVIMSLPIPNNIETGLKRLIFFVDKMLKDPNDKETEKEINEIVYELYELTEEEIKIVEKGIL